MLAEEIRSAAGASGLPIPDSSYAAAAGSENELTRFSEGEVLPHSTPFLAGLPPLPRRVPRPQRPRVPGIKYKQIGLDYEVLHSSRCGMIGSFGFEKDHYGVSIARGERVLLPAVRDR